MIRGPTQTLRLLEAAAEVVPDADDVWAALAGARCRAGQFHAAATAARRAIRLNPMQGKGHCWLLVALLTAESKHKEELQSAWVEAERAHCLPHTVGGAILNVWPDIGRADEVPETVQRLLRMEGGYPLHGDILRMEANVAAGNGDAAAEGARELLASWPGNQRANVVMGILRLKRGDVEGARRAFEGANAALESMAGHVGVAVCEARRGNGGAALSAAGWGAFLDLLEQADSGVPTASAYPNRRAMWRLLRGAASPPEAAPPEARARMLCVRGAAAHFLGDEDEAAGAFRAAVGLDPDLEPAQEYLSGGDFVTSLGLLARDGPAETM